MQKCTDLILTEFILTVSYNVLYLPLL